MNRQGQVFLLLTILSVTFLLAISTVLLDIQLSEYSEPSPDSDKLFEAWDNTISSIEQTMRIQISQNTNAGVPNGTPFPLQTRFDSLENYLNSKGLVATVQSLADANYATSGAGLSATAQLTVDIYLYIATSSGAHLEATLNMDVTYSAAITGLTLVVQKFVNGVSTFINTASVIPQTPGVVTNNGNGSYELPLGSNVYDITTPDNVILQVSN